MTQKIRQDPFARLRDNPQEPLDLIPCAKPKSRRSRAWDKQHPVISYFIPEPLHVQAQDVRADILGLAHQHMTTITSVANALVGFSISHVRQGKLSVSAVPDTTRRKMRLSWEESNDEPVRKIEIPRPNLSKQTALKKTSKKHRCAKRTIWGEGARGRRRKQMMLLLLMMMMTMMIRRRRQRLMESKVRILCKVRWARLGGPYNLVYIYIFIFIYTLRGRSKVWRTPCAEDVGL